MMTMKNYLLTPAILLALAVRAPAEQKKMESVELDGKAGERVIVYENDDALDVTCIFEVNSDDTSIEVTWDLPDKGEVMTKKFQSTGDGLPMIGGKLRRITVTFNSNAKIKITIYRDPPKQK